MCYPFPEEFGPNYPKVILICRFFIYYMIPLGIIAVFYMLMARHLVHSTKNIPGEMQGQVTRTLLVVTSENVGVRVPFVEALFEIFSEFSFIIHACYFSRKFMKLR